jgi:hypothetical protein
LRSKTIISPRTEFSAARVVVQGKFNHECWYLNKT